MTNGARRTLSMAKEKERRDSPVADEGENLDYSKVDQGSEEQPALQETTTADLSETKKKGGKGKKGEKKGSHSTALAKFRDKIRCGMCNNLMTQSKNVNAFEIKGKKVPKRVDGQPAFKSPGASSQWKAVGVLCDDCIKVSETTGKRADGTSAVDIKQAIAVREDGSVTMINISDLPEG